MHQVFISYASKSEQIAANIGSALRGTGAIPQLYLRPNRDSAVDTDTLTKIRELCESSAFFIQVLQGSAGSFVSSEGKPILQLELDWYLQKRNERGDRRPLPLVISLERPTSDDDGRRFAEYITWLEDRGVDLQFCKTQEASLEVAVGWFMRMRVTPVELSIIDGHLDVEVGLPGIDKAIEQALLRKQPLPQKFLYASPVGALFWQSLSSRHETTVSKLFDTFRFDAADALCVKKTIGLVSQWNHAAPLSIIALGCGDGRREATFALTLSKAFPTKKCRVLLVDVSKTLIANAAENFDRTLSSPGRTLGLEFALADFEHPHTLASLMQRWSIDQPTIIMFLGNTLGNINFESFLATLGSAMKTLDVLVAEVVVANEWEIRSASEKRGNWQPVSPQKDDRFDFVSGPVRILGIAPDIKNYRVKVDVGEHSINRTYGYQLSDVDIEAIAGVAKVRQYKQHTLQLIRVDAFMREPLSKLLQTMFVLCEFEVRDCERVQRDNHRARMGVFVATKLL